MCGPDNTKVTVLWDMYLTIVGCHLICFGPFPAAFNCCSQKSRLKVPSGNSAVILPLFTFMMDTRS